MKRKKNRVIKKITDDTYFSEILRIDYSAKEGNLYFAQDNDRLNIVMNNAQATIFGFFEKGTLAGWGYFRKISEEGFEITSLAVSKHNQGRGIGKQLFKKMIDTIGIKGGVEVQLTVHPHNSKAIGLYLKSGFSIDDLRRNYYGEGQDRLIMKKILN